MKQSRAYPSPHLGLVMGVLAVSTAATFIRLAQGEMSSLAVAAWRLALASLILAPFALALRWRELGSLTGREWLLAVGSGVLLAIHFASWISSLALTSVAASVALVSTNPLFVGLLSYLLLKEKPTRSMLTGMAIAVFGSAVIGLGDLGAGTHRFAGDFLALVGAIAGAGYFLIGQRLRARLSLLGYVFPVYGVAAVALVAVALCSRTQMVGHPPMTWLWLLLMAVGPQIVGHSSLNWALRHLPATYVTLAALGEPIGSALLVWWILDESPTWLAAAGGAMVLLGIAVASWPLAKKSGP
ncbi:MAG: DMT family transporter [Anaerolineae bacterium]|nr:DMT family transporter [Anaerolineae bacterium]